MLLQLVDGLLLRNIGRGADSNQQSLPRRLHSGGLSEGADFESEGSCNLTGLQATDLGFELHQQFIGYAIGLRGFRLGQVHAGFADGQSRQQAANFEGFRGGAE